MKGPSPSTSTVGYGDLTRWIGDAYEAQQRGIGPDGAVKRNALVQTHGFVGALLLAGTLSPAMDEFPLAELRLIDPCCGCGHLLLQAFDQLFARWLEAEPDTSRVVLVQRTLDSIHGVDIDRMAVAIARFRLGYAATTAAGIPFLETAPPWRIHVVWGDSLLPADDPLQPFRRDPIPPRCAGGLRNVPGDPHHLRAPVSPGNRGSDSPGIAAGKGVGRG